MIVVSLSIIIVGLIVLGVVTLLRSIYLVQQAQAIIIERFGCYNRTLTAGLHIVVPFVESVRSVYWTYVMSENDKRYYRFTKSDYRIDLRESVYDFPKQNVITRDNVTIEINALLYYQITDPKSAVYEVANLPEAIEKLTQTTLRNVIGAMDLDETLVSRDLINEKLRIILDEATDKWGVKVNRVELQEVNPPHDIRVTMEKQMRAERERRATILESEGLKRASILEAEGARQSEILRAEGLAQAKIVTAEGEAQARLKIVQSEAQAIEMIRSAAGTQDPLAYLISMQYIKTLPELMQGKDNKLILVPYEAASLMGSVAAIKKMFDIPVS